jgi:hypothetical protein
VTSSGAGQTTDWIQRLQSLANETVERSTASLADVQRLLSAVALRGVSQELLAAELSRFGQDHGLEAYQRLTEVSARFLSRSMRLVASYRDDYLRSLLPPARIAAAGPPPPVPSLPSANGLIDWTAWYQLFGAWVTEQQAWSVRLYRVLLDEVASGAMKSDALQVSARAFLDARLPDYLADMAELNADLVCELLALSDQTVVGLSESLLGSPPADELTLKLGGTVGTIASAALLVENSRPDPATVECLITPVNDFVLVTAPVLFRLGAGESRSVAVHVTLPAEETDGSVNAGTIVIRGQGDRDLVLRVRARADAAPATVWSSGGSEPGGSGPGGSPAGEAGTEEGVDPLNGDASQGGG